MAYARNALEGPAWSNHSEARERHQHEANKRGATKGTQEGFLVWIIDVGQETVGADTLETAFFTSPPRLFAIGDVDDDADIEYRPSIPASDESPKLDFSNESSRPQCCKPRSATSRLSA